MGLRRWIAVLFSTAVAAMALGLISPAAHSSCAGPQIVISRGATRVADSAYRVAPGAAIDLRISNLSANCQDTVPAGGCSAPKSARPATNVAVTVRQGNRSWKLGTVSGHGSTRSDAISVDLPSELRAGTASIRVGDGRLALRVASHD